MTVNVLSVFKQHLHHVCLGTLLLLQPLWSADLHEGWHTPKSGTRVRSEDTLRILPKVPSAYTHIQEYSILRGFAKGTLYHGLCHHTVRAPTLAVGVLCAAEQGKYGLPSSLQGLHFLYKGIKALNLNCLDHFAGYEGVAGWSRTGACYCGWLQVIKNVIK